MILKLFSWIRFIIVLMILYTFCYEYLYKKYSIMIDDFDQFNRRNNKCEDRNIGIEKKLGITVKEIHGQQFVSKLIQSPNGGIVHIGEFNNISPLQTITQALTNTLLSPLKVDSYQFNFYNWYRFQLTFTDMGHNSYFEFRLTQKNKGSHRIIQNIGFKLQEKEFYPLGKNGQGKELNIQYKAKGIELKVEQVTVNALYNDMSSDGLQSETYFHLTPNKTQLTQQQYKKFGSSKTLTKFNFTLIRKDYQINAHISHVIRHNQCITNYQQGLLRHKCMGGYGKGKVSFSQFLRKDINTKSQQYNGNWERNSYNLDNSRVRTVFIGERYIGIDSNSNSSEIVEKYIKFPILDFTSNVFNLAHHLFSVNINTRKFIQIDFIGFNKPQYYSKKDRIQKQRWVGMTLYKPLNNNGSVMKESVNENFFFINGNIHHIENIEFQLMLNDEGLRNGRIIKFWNSENINNTSSTPSKSTPSFSLQFQIQNSTLVEQVGVLSNKLTYRVDGYWRGWVDEGSLFTHNQTLRQHYNTSYEFGYVEFYQIEGTIKITQLTNKLLTHQLTTLL